MRRAKSYSIVDHQLLHGGYFQKLSHQALALYLFLVVVGNPEGRSFYADPTIERVLRLSSAQLNQARDELCRHFLIDYRRPYWWVKNIPPKEACPPAVGRGQGPLQRETNERSQTKNQISQRCLKAFVSSDPERIGDLAKEGLQNLLEQFGGNKNAPPLSSG